MFLSPSGTLGMKYWVHWAPLVRVVWLEGSSTPAEIPMENCGNCSWAAQMRCANTRGRSAVCVCASPAASPSKEAGVGEAVMRKSS